MSLSGVGIEANEAIAHGVGHHAVGLASQGVGGHASLASSSDVVDATAAPQLDFIASLLTPLNAVVFIICWLLPILGYTWWRRRVHKRRSEASPLGLFLTELTSGASAGHDRKLMGLFHPAVFRRVERGTIRAMCRCVVACYGAYVSTDETTLAVRVRGHTTSVVAKVTFANAKGVTCQAAWMRHEKGMSGSGLGAWQIIGFNILPLHSGDFDVLSFVKPEDFVGFGERFVSALFARSPSGAVGMMYATLQEKYQTEQAQAQLAKEVGKVIWACGGLRNKSEVDLTMVDARVVRSGDLEGTRTNGIEMEFAVLGRTRDMKVSLKIVFVELRCTVIRYNLSAQPAAHSGQQHILVDQDEGTQTVL
jgi:hypothetical protein